MGKMGVAIKVNRKPVLVLVAVAAVMIIWMAFGRSNSGKTFRSSARSVGLKTDVDDMSIKRNKKVPGSFYLDGKPFMILSGAMHYFRIPHQYWRDRLEKLKFMGLNTVETYVSWNLHEEEPGKFNFEGDLDIVKFVKTAHDVGLYVIIRPGPYICAEWDLGGLPSWLLRNPKIYLRSLDKLFKAATAQFFDSLIPRLTDLQYSAKGPIIAWQIENEYLSYDNDSKYMKWLEQEMIDRGVTELMFTSDGIWQMKKEKRYSLPKILRTVNFQRNETAILSAMLEVQPYKPLMVMEFWSGWFDHWGEDRHVLSLEKATQRVANILDLKSSINFYMLHGGTNFGFMNGANAQGGKYKPTITSYDYDAPISEAGDMTPKFYALQEVIRKHAPRTSSPKKLQSIPHNTEKTVYEPVEMQHFLKLDNFLALMEPVVSVDPVPMEMLPINKNGGQGYGFTLYQTELPNTAKELKIESYRDRAQVFYNSQPIDVPEPMNFEKKYLNENKTKNVIVSLTKHNAKGKNKLQILVENMGRVNFLQEINTQRKGILGDVFVDGHKKTSWKIYPLEFKPHLVNKVTSQAEWESIPENRHPGPGFYRGSFRVDGTSKDTFVSMKGWTKGVVFINGRNLGRYWNIGPQHTLFLPAPWLKSGDNIIVLFEQEGPTGDVEIRFTTEPQLGTKLNERH